MKGRVYSITGNKQNFATTLAAKYNQLASNEEWSFDSVVDGIKFKTFADGEITATFEEPIRNEVVFLVGSTNSPGNLIKMMMAADAARRASAREVVAVIPYFGYSRQDKREGMRGPIGAKVIADALVSSGINRIITIDLHADQIQGFFNIPVDHINGHHIFLPIIKRMIDSGTISDVTICSPDAGGTKRADKYFRHLNEDGCEVEFAMLNKMRNRPNEVARMDLIGDVKGRDVIIIDDMVDTAGTLSKASTLIMEAGAKSVRAICTHGVLSDPARERIGGSVLKELYISDSIPFSLKRSATDLEKLGEDKIMSVEAEAVIAKVMAAIATGKSAHSLITSEI